jgi:hypothetical protein
MNSEGIDLVLRVSENTGWLHLRDEDSCLSFTQKDIKTLLPYLQTYAETGKIKQANGKEG